jgi:diamine N-acetyltransferase
MLRRLQLKDSLFMLEWMHDKDIQKGFRRPMLSMKEEDVNKFIEDANIQVDEGCSLHFAIVDDNSDEYLGTISLKEINLINKNAEYAISLRKKAQGKGIAFKATQELLIKAFDEYGLERVYLNVFSDNTKAIRLYEKSGFLYEGEFRNHLMVNGEIKSLKWYGILKNEFKAIERS